MMFLQIRPLNVAITVFVFQSALCSYEVPLDSEPWSPKRNYRPLDYMIDITNRLGVNVLYEHNFLNDNNIAFSPYGLTGILVALYEGVEGYSALQIRDTMQIPGDRNILRIGFRDIHRRLRSYFIPEEGFLAGLSFNNENITFRQNYLDILRYYGYDFEMPTPRPTNSEVPPVSPMSEAYSTYTSSIQPPTAYDEGMYTTRNYQTTSSAPFTTQFQTTTRQQTTKTTPSVPLNAQSEMSTTRRSTETIAYIPQTTQPVEMTTTTTRKVAPTTTPVPFTQRSTVTISTTQRKDPITTTYVPQTTQPMTTTRRENTQTTFRVPQTVDNRFSGSEESSEITPAVTASKPVEVTTNRQETTNTIPMSTRTTTPILLTTQTTTPVPSSTQTTTTVPSTTQTKTPTTTPIPLTTQTTFVPTTTQTTTPVPSTTQSTTPVPLTTQSTTSVPQTTQTTSVPPITTTKSTTPTIDTRFSDESDESTETTAVPLTTQQILTTKLITTTAPLTTESEEVKTTESASSTPLTTQTVKPITIQSTVSTTSAISSTAQSVETTPLTTIKTSTTTVGFSDPTSKSETTKISDITTQSESNTATLLITRPPLSAETIQSDSTIFIGNSDDESSLESKENPTTESVKTTTTGSQKTSSEDMNLSDNESAMNISDDGEPTTNSREIRSTKDTSSVMSTFDNTLTPYIQTTLPTTLSTELSDVSSTTMKTIEATSINGPIVNDSSNHIDDGNDSEVSSEMTTVTQPTDSDESENNSTERIVRSIDHLEKNLPIKQTANLVGDLTTLENSTKGMTLMTEMFNTVEYTNTPVSTIDGMSQEDDQSLTTEGSTINTFIETTEDYKITIQVKNTEKQMSFIRTKRSLQKLKVFAPFFLDHLGFYRPVYRSPSYNDGAGMHYQNSFMANGYNKVQITYMTYDTILEFAYISYLKSMAVKLPLDTSDYYLLIILPDYKFGINDLIRDMRSRQAPSLRDINNMLSDTHVRAWVPAFMLKGLIVLTTDLQKLGICDVFEPRQEDFKPMTDQRNIYARNIEQAITVTIRKYMEPSVVKRYAYNRPPVEFAATHPFLFFVMDSSLHVALMAGKIMNPLNSRIL